MFIELTDHLRCPSEHDEAFLVLIPERVSGREVERGFLGCPICHREYPIVAGEARFGTAPAGPLNAAGGVMPDATALLSFLSLEGPGGFITLVGGAALLAAGLRDLLPGVQLVVVNPDLAPATGHGVSVLRSPRFPIKARSQRGVVLGFPEAEDPEWRHRAVSAVLPGLRIAGQGVAPTQAGFELLAGAAGWWVGRTR